MTTPDQDELRIRSLLHTIVGGPDATPSPTDAVTAAAAAAVTQPQPTRAPNTAPAADWWDELYADDAPPAAAAGDAQPRSHRRMRIPPWWSGQSADLSKPEPDTADSEDDSEPLDDHDQPDADAQPDGPDEDAQRDEPDAPAAPQPVKPQPTGAKRRRPAAQSRTRSRRPRANEPRALVDAPPMRRSLLDAYAAVPPRIRWLLVHLSAAAAGYALGWVDWATRTTAWIFDNGPLTPTAMVLYGLAVACECLRYRTRTWRLPVRWLCAVPITSIVIGAALYGTGWTELELPL